MRAVIKFFLNMFFIIFVLSGAGCVTSKLSSNIRSYEKDQTFYKDDEILGAAATPSDGGKFQWVFIGKHFDYRLDSGAEEFMNALVTGKIDKYLLSVSREGDFRLNDKRSGFYGYIRLKFNYNNDIEKKQVSESLNSSSYMCYPTWQGNGVGECEIYLYDLAGTIHQKATIPKDTLWFNKPVEVGFYTKNSLSVKRVFYPAAIAADVALSPLYLMGYAIVFGAYGGFSK